jgi:hypothetical protein
MVSGKETLLKNKIKQLFDTISKMISPKTSERQTCKQILDGKEAWVLSMSELNVIQDISNIEKKLLSNEESFLKSFFQKMAFNVNINYKKFYEILDSTNFHFLKFQFQRTNEDNIGIVAVSHIEHPLAKMSGQSHDLVENKRTVKVYQLNKTPRNDTAESFFNESISLSSANMETSSNTQSEEITRNNNQLSLYETKDWKISNQEVFDPIEKLDYINSANFRSPSWHQRS